MSPLIEDSSEEEDDEESFHTKKLFSFAWQIAKRMVITVIFIVLFSIKRAGGGGIPIMTHMGMIRLKRVPFLGFLHERVGISLAEVYERILKSVIFVISVCKKI